MSPKVLLGIILVGLLLGGVGCGVETSSQDLPTEERSGADDSVKRLSEEYWLFAHVHDFTGNYKLTVNGFPVEQEPVNVTMTDQEIGARLNTALVGKGNTASVRVEPYLQRNGDQLVVGNVDLEAWVSREAKDGENIPISQLNGKEGTRGITEADVDSAYKEWQERSARRWKEYLRWEKQWIEKHPDSSSTITSREGGALDSIEAWSDQNPLTVSTTFDNEAGPDFSRIFEEAPVLEDTPSTRKRLKDYAMHLRDLMAGKDTAGLTQEFLPVLWTGKDSLDVSDLRSNFSEEQIQSVREHIVIENAYLDLARPEVGLRRWAGGRVWELYYEPDGKALFGARTFREGTPEYTGSGRKREVYVAELGGRLKVVR